LLQGAGRLGLALLLGAGGCAADAPARRPDILLISIDTLRADRLGCYGYGPARYARRGSLKFIDAPRRELYDLAADPGERDNLYPADPGRAAPLASMLDAIAGREEADARSAADAERADRLRSLGYLSAPPARRPEGPLADPKDRIEVYERLRAAHLEAQRGDPAAGLAAFASLEPELRESPVFYEFWGDVAVRARRLPLGIDRYRRSLALDPSGRSARHDLAVALSLTGETQAALAEFEDLLRRYPDHAKGHLLAGLLYHRLGSEEAARDHLTTFLRLQPDHPQAGTVRALLKERAGGE
jgi:tetratricopeptide (TPR) repeat protein